MSDKFKPFQPCNAVVDKIKLPCGTQPKWDGEKLITKGGLALSRSMKPIRNKQIIKDVIDGVLPHNVEGEIQTNGLFADSAGHLNSGSRSSDYVYHVFDSVDPARKEWPYSKRLDYLYSIIGTSQDKKVRVVPTTTVDNMEDLMTIHATNAAHPSLDGTIIRDMDSPYKYGRATVTKGDALKLKDFDDSEARIIGFTERMHNTNEAKKNELGRTARSSAQDGLVPTGLLATYICDWNGVEISVTATGTLESREERWICREGLIDQLVKFQYQGTVKDGKPRFPTEIALRDPSDMGE